MGWFSCFICSILILLLPYYVTVKAQSMITINSGGCDVYDEFNNYYPVLSTIHNFTFAAWWFPQQNFNVDFCCNQSSSLVCISTLNGSNFLNCSLASTSYVGVVTGPTFASPYKYAYLYCSNASFTALPLPFCNAFSYRAESNVRTEGLNSTDLFCTRGQINFEIGFYSTIALLLLLTGCWLPLMYRSRRASNRSTADWLLLCDIRVSMLMFLMVGRICGF